MRSPAENYARVKNWRAQNPDKFRTYRAKYYRSPKGQAAYRRYHLLRNYDMTEVEYDALVAEQGGACAICGGLGDRLHVDHNHQTGEVRGLLCLKCNTFLGVLEQSDWVQSAQRYLERGMNARSTSRKSIPVRGSSGGTPNARDAAGARSAPRPGSV